MQNEIEELQTRLAFQEDALQETSKTLARQQAEISELRVMIKHLQAQIQEMGSADIPVNTDDRPPHY